MLVTEVTVRIHETVNTGDYSNYKPEIALTATLDASDDIELVLGQLINQATEEIANLVDDALERNGQPPKYEETLYKVRYSDLRRCIALYRLGIDLPKEMNWHDADTWHSHHDRDYPGRMRFETAQKLAYDLRRTKDFPIFIINEVDALINLPPLPDPGPEPLWYTKGLRDGLRKLNVPNDTWDRVGDLPHVTADYLDRFYTWYHRSFPYHMSTSQMVDIFIAGGKPWENAAATPEPDGFDEEE